MILMQAAIAGGIVLAILLGLLLLIGVPVLVTLLMRLYWKVAGKKDSVKKKRYKEIIPFISIVIFSIVALLLLFYLLVKLLSGVYPSFE